MLPAYAELHCRSNFSFLTGASHPQELVFTAAALGQQAIGINFIGHVALGTSGRLYADQPARLPTATPAGRSVSSPIRYPSRITSITS